MATLETLYLKFLRENPNSTLRFSQWKKEELLPDLMVKEIHERVNEKNEIDFAPVKGIKTRYAKQKRIYVDMDDTLCDFMGASWLALKEKPEQRYPQAEMDFFRKLRPHDGAIEAMNKLAEGHDVWILTRPSYRNPLCYTEKRLWVEDHLGLEWCEKLILCPDKSLMKGDYLIDDIRWDEFEGEQLVYGNQEFSTWDSVLTYFDLDGENTTR